MYKASIELAKINKYMKIKFNLIINDTLFSSDDNKSYKKDDSGFGYTLQTFSFNGSDYLRVAPKPYITVDISATSDKNDAWNSNTQVTINRLSLFEFLRRIKSIMDKFTIKDLFYMKDKKLYVNNSLAEKSAEYVRTPNKMIKMIPVVVYDEDNKELEYEGICFMINSEDNFCCLTYYELEYLYDVLNKVNMDELSMSLLNTYLITMYGEKITNDNKKVDNPVLPKVIEESKEEEKPVVVLPKIIPPNTVPDI